jgi:hypothetical protein
MWCSQLGLFFTGLFFARRSTKLHKPKLLITEETIGMAAGILYIHTVCTYSNDKTACIAKGCLPDIWVC